MKESICTVSGAIGGLIAAVFGGWDTAIVTLILFMAIDFALGLMTAALGRSKHSKSGGLNSRAGALGLARKFTVLLLIVVAVRVDLLLGTDYVRDAVCIGFCCNEMLSILENTSLVGVPYPKALKKALDVLQDKAGETVEPNNTKDSADAEESEENHDSDQ